MTQLFKYLGDPSHTLEMKIVTDSQASIVIMQNIQKIIGMKDLLKTNIDVTMELNEMRKQKLNLKRELCKVKSHVLEEEAENEFYWKVNNEADELATSAREMVSKGKLTAFPPPFFKGTKVMYMVDGEYRTDKLREGVKDSITRNEMKEFLRRKYDWTERIFSTIDCDAHKSAIGKFNSVVQVTIHKQVYGWLATQVRKSRESRSITTTCLLCDGVNDLQHMYCCKNEEVRKFWKRELGSIRTQLQKLMDSQASEAIMIGVSGVGNNNIEVYRREFVTREIVQKALIAQESIGWLHVMHGRLAQEWQTVWMQEAQDNCSGDISCKVAAIMLNNGLAIWRNRII